VTCGGDVMRQGGSSLDTGGSHVQQIDRQTDRRTDRQTDRQTDGQTMPGCCLSDQSAISK